jgi:hypothetical protein
MAYLPKPKRIVDGAFLDFVRGRRCTVPGCRHSEDADPHHIITRGAGGSDYFAIPLCREHHGMIHHLGKHRFESDTGLDIWQVSARILSLYIERLQQRVEELKEKQKAIDVIDHIGLGAAHIITTEQIDEMPLLHMLNVFFGIKRCEKCNGRGYTGPLAPNIINIDCPDCDGHGWVKR